MYYFFERNYQALRDASNDGSQKNLNASLLKQFTVGFPSRIQEQKSIAASMKILDDHSSREAERLHKLRLQKLGLMQDLLTGKVAVPVDALQTEPAA